MSSTASSTARCRRSPIRLLLNGSYRERLRNQSCLYQPLTVVFRPSGIEYHEDAGEDGSHFFCIELGGPWQDRVRGLDEAADALWVSGQLGNRQRMADRRE